MKRILLAAAAIGATAFALMAATDSFQMTVTGPRAGIMGGVVKNAPYSGEEVSTVDNTLGDGTKIHTENHTKVYRDSEGRTRRETDDMINIYDPVAGVAYILNPKTMTARQMKVNAVTIVHDGPLSVHTGTITGYATTNNTFVYQTDTVTTNGDSDAAVRAGKVTLDTMAVEHQAKATTQATAAMDKMMAAQLQLDAAKADAEARMEIMKIADGSPVGGTLSLKTTARATGKKEPLGTQVMEGLVSEGIRTTSTFEVGAIGNDRPINSVSERWTSGDLKTVVLTKHSDPRSGEEVFRLTNVNRNEPDPALFQLPSGYTMAGESRLIPR